MSIEITIVKSPSNLQNAKPYQIFTEQGGTIGRSADNTWIVEDPDKFISSKHSQIVFEHGQYYLMDLSTNGTFLNGSGEPVGHGNRVPLKDGDRFALGEYEFLVSMRNSAHASANSDPFGNGAFAGIGGSSGSEDDMLGISSGRHDDPFSNSSPAFDSSIAPLLTPGFVENDPLEALDKANRGGMHNAFARGHVASQPDNADPMQHAVKWPNTFADPKSAIPEDWFKDEDLSSPVSAPQKMPDAIPPRVDSRHSEKLQALEQRCAALEAERLKLLGHIKVLTQQQQKSARTASTSVPSSAAAAIDETLIEAMGLSKWDLPAQKKAEISQIAGAIVRVTMEGLMQALAFRKKIKEEFRINVTTIQPVENNPLKFSANLDDALENMFVKENKAYQKPLDAVREGFHGISEHQLAVLAGMQAAFRGMIDRLDPVSLEQRFEKYRKAGVIKVGQKAKNWESYKEFHKDLVNDIDNSFQHLFGYDFVQAYEEQLQRLLVARKARTKSSAKD